MEAGKIYLLWFFGLVYFDLVASQGAVEQSCEADGTCHVTPDEKDTTSTCTDENELCGYWASAGECTVNLSYMSRHCRRSCELCNDQVAASPIALAKENPFGVGADLGVAQLLTSDSFHADEQQVLDRIVQSQTYMKNADVPQALKDLCRNEHDMCTVWAIWGECETNPKYMKKTCAPACFTCDYLSVETRCPLDPDAPSAWGPGDLDAMFVRLLAEPYISEYDVQVLSSPNTTGGPWVVTMDNVVSELEALRLIELGSIEGYEQSSDVGKLKADGTYDKNVNSGRTSTNAWCQNACYEDKVAQDVVQRLSNITGINETNSEYLQLLNYEEGQLYKVHHDYIEHHITRRQGVRILTLYLYLNDVDAGGGTNFDELDITVMPKRGRALLWPSVLDDDPDNKDFRTTHQALPVEAGMKYGANAWFHQRDFKTPNREGCQ